MNLVWSVEASDSLEQIYVYILEESPQNALMVIDEIIKLAEKLKDERFEYSIDPIINKHNYRHINIWSYKIIYMRNLNSVIILDVFDGRQNQKKLNKYK